MSAGATRRRVGIYEYTALSMEEAQANTPALGEPYCSHCGHQLTGLIDSSRCPECGKPIVEVLTRRAAQGRRYRSETTLFGLPLVDIAFGPTDTETSGSARGVIAIGDSARGLVAIGGKAFGVVALGGRAIGLFAAGGFSIGLLSAWGGVAIGAIANGGVALGLLAFGGLAIGLAASGGVAIGVYAVGGAPFGLYALGPGRNDQAALDFFQHFEWYFGPAYSFGLWSFIQPIVVTFGLIFAVGGLICLLAILTHMRKHAVSKRASPS